MKKKKILSIDSGGIKGLIPAVIINYIETLIQNKTNNKNAKIGDYFDMIAGTSTGGILACFYLCPSDEPNNKSAKYFASEAVKFYSEKGHEIFKPKIEKSINKLSNLFLKREDKEGDANLFISSLNTANNLFTEEYSELGLEAILMETMGDTTLSSLLKHCFIISYDISTCQPVMFSTQDAKKYSHRDYYLRDVARATSAAPTYFKLATIKSLAGASKHLIDGGIFAPNPTMCAIIEANKIFYDSPQSNIVEDFFVVSIGTGNEKEEYDYKKAQNWGIVHWAVPVINITMSALSTITDYQVKTLFDNAKLTNNYFRISPDLCNAKFNIDNVSKENIHNLNDAALYYIDKNAEKLDEIAEKIISL